MRLLKLRKPQCKQHPHQSATPSVSSEHPVLADWLVMSGQEPTLGNPLTSSGGSGKVSGVSSSQAFTCTQTASVCHEIAQMSAS